MIEIELDGADRDCGDHECEYKKLWPQFHCFDCNKKKVRNKKGAEDYSAPGSSALRCGSCALLFLKRDEFFAYGQHIHPKNVEAAKNVFNRWNVALDAVDGFAGGFRS